MKPRLYADQRVALNAVWERGYGGRDHMHAWPDEIADKTIISLRRRRLTAVGRCGIAIASGMYPSSKCDYLTPLGKEALGVADD